MSDIENFLAGAKPNSSEARLAAKYKTISSEVEKLQTTLLRRIRVGKDSRGRLVPIFQDGVEPLATELEAKDAEVKAVTSDIDEFMKICGGPSIDQLLLEEGEVPKSAGGC